MLLRFFREGRRADGKCGDCQGQDDFLHFINFLNFSVPQLSDAQSKKSVQLLALFVMALEVVFFALVMFLMLPVLVMFARMHIHMNDLRPVAKVRGPRWARHNCGVN